MVKFIFRIMMCISVVSNDNGLQQKMKKLQWYIRSKLCHYEWNVDVDRQLMGTFYKKGNMYTSLLIERNILWNVWKYGKYVFA